MTASPARRFALLPDPELSAHSYQLSRQLENYAGRIEAEDLGALFDSIAVSQFGQMLERIGADSGTVWLINDTRTKLVAGFNPREPGIIGQEQPLDEGLISMVMAHENAICENAVAQNPEHSPIIEQATGTRTQAMIAVPFYFGQMPRGVISCVQFVRPDGEPPAQGFRGWHQAAVEETAHVLGRLLDLRLIRVILDLHD